MSFGLVVDSELGGEVDSNSHFWKWILNWIGEVDSEFALGEVDSNSHFLKWILNWIGKWILHEFALGEVDSEYALREVDSEFEYPIPGQHLHL